jgi:hypothetical protein
MGAGRRVRSERIVVAWYANPNALTLDKREECALQFYGGFSDYAADPSRSRVTHLPLETLADLIGPMNRAMPEAVTIVDKLKSPDAALFDTLGTKASQKHHCSRRFHGLADHLDAANPRATFVGNLQEPDILRGSLDCIALIPTLHFWST